MKGNRVAIHQAACFVFMLSTALADNAGAVITDPPHADSAESSVISKLETSAEASEGLPDQEAPARTAAPDLANLGVQDTAVVARPVASSGPPVATASTDGFVLSSPRSIFSK